MMSWSKGNPGAVDLVTAEANKRSTS